MIGVTEDSRLEFLWSEEIVSFPVAHHITKTRWHIGKTMELADVVELADTLDLGSSVT